MNSNERSVRSIAKAAQAAESADVQLSEEEAGALLGRCDGEVKTAIVSILAQVSPGEARRRLAAAGGFVRRACAGLDEA